MNSQEQDVTALLRAYSRGQDDSGEELLQAVYPELRRIARRMLGRLRSGETLDTTALVHEAYLKLDGKGLEYQDRVHYFALCARAMRQILIDHARSHQSGKRGGDVQRVPLEGIQELVSDRKDHDAASSEAESLIALDRSLEALESIEPRLVRVVECRFFGGMSEKEIALALDMSVSTVQRSWVKARAWLHDRLAA